MANDSIIREPEPTVAPEFAKESGADLVACLRHEVESCPRCDGSGFRPRRRCEGCGEPSERRSEGGRALSGLRNAEGKDQPMWCLWCHPEHRFLDAHWSCLEILDG